jgi:hypothetical protein
MNKLDSKKRAQVVAALVEGSSIRATCRMTGAAKNTVTKLLVELGTACERFQQKTLVVSEHSNAATGEHLKTGHFR